jgi:hypothetical protein
MAKVSINLQQFFTEPGGYQYGSPQASQVMESIRAQFLEECLALGVKVEGGPIYGNTVDLQCTPKQLKAVFSLRDSVRVWFSTPLGEAKCKRVFKLLKGTEATKELGYGSFYWNPCAIQGHVTSYEDYSLVMNTVKDVRKNYTVVQRAVKI